MYCFAIISIVTKTGGKAFKIKQRMKIERLKWIVSSSRVSFGEISQNMITLLFFLGEFFSR